MRYVRWSRNNLGVKWFPKILKNIWLLMSLRLIIISLGLIFVYLYICGLSIKMFLYILYEQIIKWKI